MTALTRAARRSEARVPDRPRMAASTDLRPPTRIRKPEVAVGVLVTALFALGAVLWHLHTIEKVPALAVASRIDRGAAIERSDLRVVYVPADTGLARLDVDRIDAVIGQLALVDLPAGSLVTPSLVVDAAIVGDGQGIVGLSLDPGAYPATGLAPGDRVNVVRALDVAALDEAPVVIATDTTVFAVEALSSDRLLVSVLTDQADAERVAASAASGGLRLVMVTS